MKRLSNAFSVIFSDNEWFNKILIGGFYFLLIPVGIGIIMINGFLSALIMRSMVGEKGMPYWRNYKSIFHDGLRKSSLSLSLIAVVYALVLGFQLPISVPGFIIAVSLFLTINTISIVKKFDTVSFLLSLPLLFVAISIGWMWIVVGWPLLIFLAVIVQTHLFSKI
ncbi:MAG: hypothetical protein Q8L88_09610 [Bacteroidota bacterium]|nr:hypothetical protein [Bacteroidota bacterium]